MKINTVKDVIKYIEKVRNKTPHLTEWITREALEDYGQNMINVDEDFMVGDKVKVINTDGPKMLISCIFPPADYNTNFICVVCKYYNNVSGKWCEESFAKELLEKV